jgi:RNA polymerase sigma-70 factor (ECF subfamily)
MGVVLVDDAVSDAELLDRHLRGDAGGFAGLYRRYAPALHLYAQALTRDADAARDLVQETFVRAMDAAGLRGSVRPMLYTIARNLAADERRKADVRRRARPLLALAARADAPAPSHDAEAVSQALDALPDEQREAVVLKIYAGLGFAEIAELTGVSTATAASRYRYAIEKLAALLPAK